jgi:glycine cleavage system H protein
MIETDLKFTKSHEWIEPAGGRRKVGISQFAQEQLGDIVFVEFKEEGLELAAGEEACLIESCKATASVYAPVAGKIVAFNKALENAPETINQDPYGEGWLFEIEPAAGADEAALLDLTAYQKTCEEA